MILPNRHALRTGNFTAHLRTLQVLPGMTTNLLTRGLALWMPAMKNKLPLEPAPFCERILLASQVERPGLCPPLHPKLIRKDLKTRFQTHSGRTFGSLAPFTM